MLGITLSGQNNHEKSQVLSSSSIAVINANQQTFLTFLPPGTSWPRLNLDEAVELVLAERLSGPPVCEASGPSPDCPPSQPPKFSLSLDLAMAVITMAAHPRARGRSEDGRFPGNCQPLRVWRLLVTVPKPNLSRAPSLSQRIKASYQSGRRRVKSLAQGHRRLANSKAGLINSIDRLLTLPVPCVCLLTPPSQRALETKAEAGMNKDQVPVQKAQSLPGTEPSRDAGPGLVRRT